MQRLNCALEKMFDPPVIPAVQLPAMMQIFCHLIQTIVWKTDLLGWKFRRK